MATVRWCTRVHGTPLIGRRFLTILPKASTTLVPASAATSLALNATTASRSIGTVKAASSAATNAITNLAVARPTYATRNSWDSSQTLRLLSTATLRKASGTQSTTFTGTTHGVLPEMRLLRMHVGWLVAPRGDRTRLRKANTTTRLTHIMG